MRGYQQWIDEHVPTDESALARCAEVTLAMVEAFPELLRVRGHYFCQLWNADREHWWCETADGEIWDPTVRQFPSKGHGIYTPWEEGQPEPTGKCIECGEHCYDGKTFCSQAHERAFMRSLHEQREDTLGADAKKPHKE